MEWRHATWQCPRCSFKLGCCEGDPQTPCDVPAPAGERIVTASQRTIPIPHR
jgi:hypothetical protein